jgi:hypothetical protein
MPVGHRFDRRFLQSTLTECAFADSSACTRTVTLIALVEDAAHLHVPPWHQLCLVSACETRF